ncbi:HAUS augmin-like complex subunit 3 [Hemicordylus capensis]|uniref:HAUS augmin-like complex subunit 3 n=1 Tax=Hemicordylus capensis TaxID=884348 RepID=UPI0023025CDE|nr:HAUS augmin-like complex subunit 3 [Hemicordylus capensis]XP_053106551.1 HAUS augmin-like complex subunit 3 [Hemicordylus capensis]XP_053106552.1 HAUS augmin-like complex subunit 3 [Hemicordylus capensis]XP_053106553.1 HAUS augmin-like complex subunit 3 [Hemicordylus capensis]XP_053106554.1 HAUS augmin-like complex subunit 3 [Hemicordylus capensis]
MDCGTQFVETLKRIGYSKAASLNGEDFDWLFETLEDKSFLEWFCTSLNEYHSLSAEELHSFHTLKSAKPVLEEEALDEVLKTCKSLDINSSTCEEEEQEKLKTLEDELQMLQKIKQRKIHDRNKLQAMASTNSLMSLKLKEIGEETSKNLKESQGIFTAINTKINNELQSLIERTEKLTSYFAVAHKQQELDPHPVMLAQLALDQYLCQEERSTAALTSYTKKQFFQGISELVESSNEEKFQLVDIRNASVCVETKDVFEERQELTRLQMAYICSQNQLIQQNARYLSMRSGLHWAEENICSVKKKTSGTEELEARISSLNNEISKMKKQLTHINNETLPMLVKQDAELLNMPVVRGDFDLQIARQDYYISRQDQICNQLIKQKASFELLQLAYEIELRKLRDNSRLLENMAQDLKRSSNSLVQTLEAMSEPSISDYKIPRSAIDSRDDATHRLYELMEGKNSKQLLRTQDGLEQMAEKLHLDTVSVLDQLAASSQEQILLMSKMDSDLVTLQNSMYCKGESVCLSNQDLTEQFHQLEFQLNKLNQLIMDFLADMKAKKRVLENNKLQQMERKLYMYFFKDAEYLKNIVERTEQQAKTQVMT